jgi:hypothetical protein
MHKSFKVYLHLLFLAPVIGYFTISYFARRPVYYLQFSVAAFFILYILRYRFYIQPRYALTLLLYTIYIWGWNFFNGYFENKGLFKFLFTNMHLYNVLLLFLIYNMRYSDKFIKYSLLFIQLYFVILIAGQMLQFFINPDLFVPDFWSPDFVTDPTIYEIRRPSVFALVSDHEIGISILALFALYFGYSINVKKMPWIWLLLGVLYAILTNTRYIMAGMVLVLFQFYFGVSTTSKRLKYFITLFIAIIIGYYLIVNVFGYKFETFYKERLFAEQDITKTSRYFAVEIFAEHFPKHPWFGTGVNLTPEIAKEIKGRSSQIHIGYLAHLVSYGIFGSLLLFGFWFSVLRSFYKRARITKFYGSFFAFLMLIWANVTLVSYEIFYIGIIYAFIFDKYYYDRYLISKHKNNDIPIPKKATILFNNNRLPE